MTKFRLASLILLIVILASQGSATTYQQIGQIEDSSYARIKRVSARIIVPDGLSREELKETLTNAVRNISIQHNTDAAMILAYRSQDKDIADSAWTAGMAVYAPNGQWADAAHNAEKKISVQLGDIYFQQKSDHVIEKNSFVTFVSENENPVSVSRSRDAWTDDQIIAKIPSGNTATVLERYEKLLTAGHLFIRYRIRTTYQGKPIEGWVFDDDIAQHKNGVTAYNSQKETSAIAKEQEPKPDPFSTRYDELTTRDGTVYHRAAPQRIEDDMLVIFHSRGISRISLDNLTDDMRADLGLPNKGW